MSSEIDKAKAGEMFASLSHDLKNQLNVVIGFSEGMMSGIYGPVSKEQEVCLGHILKGGENLLKMINEIVSISREQQGLGEQEP